MTPPANRPSGTYTLRIGVWDPKTPSRFFSLAFLGPRTAGEAASFRLRTWNGSDLVCAPRDVTACQSAYAGLGKAYSR
jgi:hypothetical protein